MDLESVPPIFRSEKTPTPLSQVAFDALRRDEDWQFSEVYHDTFEVVRDSSAKKVPEVGGKVHYLLKRTGRADFPYLLYGPFVGGTSRVSCPSAREVEAYFGNTKRNQSVE
jgi:hypothetical protein